MITESICALVLAVTMTLPALAFAQGRRRMTVAVASRSSERPAAPMPAPVQGDQARSIYLGPERLSDQATAKIVYRTVNRRR